MTAVLQYPEENFVLRELQTLAAFEYVIEDSDSPVMMIMEGLGYYSENFDLKIPVKEVKT